MGKCVHVFFHSSSSSNELPIICSVWTSWVHRTLSYLLALILYFFHKFSSQMREWEFKALGDVSEQFHLRLFWRVQLKLSIYDVCLCFEHKTDVHTWLFLVWKQCRLLETAIYVSFIPINFIIISSDIRIWHEVHHICCYLTIEWKIR